MFRIRYLFVLATIFILIFSDINAKPLITNDALFPEVKTESRPWTYWWWMGSAVEREEITKNLEAFSAAGIGGVHIIPIYGVKGFEDQYIDFLSPVWMDMFSHTVQKANRLNMGVDMSTGTGWPFGGPMVTTEHAAKTFKIKKGLNGYSIRVAGTGQMVKRAAPGGEGLVLDYYSRDSVSRYLSEFDKAFSKTKKRPRSFYNDSFEAFGADWTTGLLEEFRARRGYDLSNHLAALSGKGDSDYAVRVLCDYRETVSDLLLENFTKQWVVWAHKHNALTRNQAHGSPGNLLDLYAAVDVPETEAFGHSHFEIPGLEYKYTLPGNRNIPDVLVTKFASSAAHVVGGRLVSSESCTWLGEHFTISLSQVKPEIDKLWLGGVNHVFFHGIAYSPFYEDWPGWLFYASTNFGLSNTFFRDLAALNAYIGRTQAFLQKARPANDLLIYWPVHDLWSGVYDKDPIKRLAKETGKAFVELFNGRFMNFVYLIQGAVVGFYESKMSQVKTFTVHDADDWMHSTPFGELVSDLYEKGYTFDYISDNMIKNISYDGKIRSESGSFYRAVVIPDCHYMPDSTMMALAELHQKGATVIFADGIPEDVPGLGDLKNRRKRFTKARRKIAAEKYEAGDIEVRLARAGILPEPMVKEGLSFIRGAHKEGYVYFIANQGQKHVDGWIELAMDVRSAVIFDTMHEISGVAAMKNGKHGASVYLQIAPGQSLVLKTFPKRGAHGPKWVYLEEAAGPFNISGEWKVEFIEGGPFLPEAFQTKRLASWTEMDGPGYKSFSGTASYTVKFSLPHSIVADEWTLDLGRVHESARVYINGEFAGTVFCHPFRISVGKYLKKAHNLLRIEVTNLSANRIIYMNRQDVDWKKFHDINFVNIYYLPFNTWCWKPFASGLIGPVNLLPLSTKQID